MISPQLSRRLGDALGTKYATFEEQDAVRAAAENAVTWDDLPNAIQALILDIEQRPDPWGQLGE